MQNKVSITEATALARQYKGHLVSVETVEEQAWIGKTFLMNYDTCVWTRGRKTGKKWHWFRGTRIDAEIKRELFHPAEPNNLDGNEDIIALYGGKRAVGYAGKLLDANTNHRWFCLIEITRGNSNRPVGASQDASGAGTVRSRSRGGLRIIH